MTQRILFIQICPRLLALTERATELTLQLYLSNAQSLQQWRSPTACSAHKSGGNKVLPLVSERHIITEDTQLARAEFHVTGTHMFFMQKEKARFIPTIIMLQRNTITIGTTSTFTNGNTISFGQ